MHTLFHDVLHDARARELHDDARTYRLARPLRSRRRRARWSVMPHALREAVGFRLIEAGLRLAVGDGRHPPSTSGRLRLPGPLR